MEKFSQHLTTVVETGSENEGETFVDLQRAYGFLLSACKLKETPPPEHVSTIIIMARVLLTHLTFDVTNQQLHAMNIIISGIDL